jgi:hypothetical protein
LIPGRSAIGRDPDGVLGDTEARAQGDQAVSGHR